MNMELRPVPKEEPVLAKIAMGIIPCYNDFYVAAAWKLIKPIEEKFSKDSMEEYSVLDVWKAIYYGQAHLYLGYLDPSGKVTEEMSQAFVMAQVAKNPLEGWVGFVLTRFENNSLFVWQVYITPQFQNTEAIRVGLEWLKGIARDRGAQFLSFSSYRHEWEKVGPKLDFTETYTVFRHKL